MTYNPNTGSLSGPPWTPFLPTVIPVPSGALTVYSGPINGTTGTETIGPLINELTTQGCDETLDIPFAAAGSVTIVQPAYATSMVIKPPAANTVGLMLGTDVPLSPSAWSAISFPTTGGGATYVLTALGAIVGNVVVNFA